MGFLTVIIECGVGMVQFLAFALPALELLFTFLPLVVVPRVLGITAMVRLVHFKKLFQFKGLYYYAIIGFSGREFIFMATEIWMEILRGYYISIDWLI